MSAPITAVEIRPEDWDEFCTLRARLAEMVQERISKDFSVFYKAEPALTFQGCQVIQGK